jgi:cyclopropane-fatty-acyl-phospholipid synthase
MAGERLNKRLFSAKRTMRQDRPKAALKKILSLADIRINGTNPWDIQVHNENFYHRVLARGSLGLGESYMDGWWDCSRLDELFCRLLSYEVESKVKKNLSILYESLRARIVNMQSRKRAFHIGENHYDLDNELFKNMLDSRRTYSCGYWRDANTLEEAQAGKLELICRKLKLRPRMKVLDIGCGWGSFVKYAAEKYEAEVVGITVSKEQVEFACDSCNGLPVDIRIQDYRGLNGKFDHIVSVGMFEHVGSRNYRTFMKVVHNCLKDDGLFLLHSIGGNRQSARIDPWMNRYIFPNAVVPTVKQVGKAIEGLFIMEDWHNFSTDYDRTLMSWHENFENNWHRIKSKYNERFYRMWKLYLLACAGAFRSRTNQLWQIVLSKKGVPGGYESIR